jgi:hypothetical protein
VAREAALLHKVASAKSSSTLLEGSGAAGAGAAGAAGAASAARQRGLHSSVSRGDVGQPVPPEQVYLARRDFAALDNTFAAAGPAPAAARHPRQQQQQQQQHGSKYTRGLYLAGLQGMLWEMRAARPPGTPCGHTQQLTPQLAPGQARSKVCARVCVCVYLGEEAAACAALCVSTCHQRPCDPAPPNKAHTPS